MGINIFCNFIKHNDMWGYYNSPLKSENICSEREEQKLCFPIFFHWIIWDVSKL